MNTPVVNGHHSRTVLDELRAARAHTARCLYIALQHLDAAQATVQAHALPYPLGDTRNQLQSALDLVNKDISDRGNAP